MKDLNITSYDGGGVAVPSGYEGNEEFLLTEATSQVEVEVYDGTGCPKNMLSLSSWGKYSQKRG